MREILRIRTDARETLVDITPQVKPANGMAGETDHFVECCLKGKKPIMDAQQGVVLMKMLDGIYKSQATGREVKL